MAGRLIQPDGEGGELKSGDGLPQVLPLQMVGHQPAGDGLVDQIEGPLIHRLAGDGNGLPGGLAWGLQPDPPVQGLAALAAAGEGGHMVEMGGIPDHQIALTGQEGVQGPVSAALGVGEDLHQQKGAGLAAHPGPDGDQSGGVGLRIRIGEGLSAQGVQGELISRLAALKGGRRRARGEQTEQQGSGEKSGQDLFHGKQESFL